MYTNYKSKNEMKYFINILWLLSWPLMIYISYKASLAALKVFERNAAIKSGSGTRQEKNQA
jgi:hypothetical protein